jgi:hypothetical protein
LAVATLIEEVCRQKKFLLEIVNVELPDKDHLVERYNIHMLPTYVFVENDDIVYKGFGTVPRHVIERNLK